VDGCNLTIHIGEGKSVTIGLTVEDAYRVGSALATFAVEACKLAWTETIGRRSADAAYAFAGISTSSRAPSRTRTSGVGKHSTSTTRLRD
jgi:hypothetical protein